MELSQTKKDLVESYRGTNNSSHLEYLKRLWEQETGTPIKTGCFCKSTNKDAFLKGFYKWYDKNYPKAEEPETTDNHEDTDNP